MKNQPGITIGIDLGNRKHDVCVIDRDAKVVETRSIGSDRNALRRLAKKYPNSRVVIECGIQSPWISRFLTENAMEVIVANARKVRAIWDQDFKSDTGFYVLGLRSITWSQEGEGFTA